MIINLVKMVCEVGMGVLTGVIYKETFYCIFHKPLHTSAYYACINVAPVFLFAEFFDALEEFPKGMNVL